MWARIGAMVRKEFIQIGRDRRTLGMVIAMPIMMLLLYGYGINIVIDHLPLVVFNEANDPESRALVTAMQNSSYFDVVQYVHTQDAMTSAIDGGTAKVAIHIPPDFGTAILRGEQGQAQLVVDGSDPNNASTASFAAGMVAQAQSTRIITQQLARRGMGGLRSGVEMRPVVLYNPSLKSVNFMIPSIIGLIMSFQTILLTAFAVTREREQGTLEQIIVTPIRTWEFMLGKILPYTVTSTVGAFGAVLGARLIFGFRIAGDLGLLILLSVLFLMGSLGLGLLVSVVSKTQGQATQTAMFIMIPSILLSGFIFSRDAMPWIVRQLGLLVPLTYYIQIVRGIMLKGVGIESLWSAVWPLLIYSIVVFGLSAVLFQKRTV